jgi:serpin B
VEARKQINAWVAKVTRNLITEVLDPNGQSRETVNVVANAIYFKGVWVNPFDKEDTMDHRKFFLLDGISDVKVSFMRRPMFDYEQIACHDGFKVLKLSYTMVDYNSPGYSFKMQMSLPRFSMCVFLPDARDGLLSLVGRMTSHPDFLQVHLPTEYVPVGDFLLPKFKLPFQSSIIDVLKSLGLRLPFESHNMDLTEIVEGPPLFVSDVIHKAVIEVSEAGSEAAAYTELVYVEGCSRFHVKPPPPKPVDFIADHPFAFFIIEETTSTVVFSGHVLNPSKEG